MKTVIITGASSGLGVEFFHQAAKMPEAEEIWLIARRRENLEKLAEQTDKPVYLLPLDLADEDSFAQYERALQEKQPDVIAFINNAGLGTIGAFAEMDRQSQTNMCDVNVRALTAMANSTLRYMHAGSYMINTCSIASFAPNANMTVYSSTKAYVRSFSRGLRFELKKKKINVLALCPGPMTTEFLEVAGIRKGVSTTFDLLPRVNVRKAAEGAMKRAKQGRAIYTPHPFYKIYRVLAKLIPTSLMMHLSKT